MINGVTPTGSQALQPLRQATPAPAAPAAPVKSAEAEIASAPTLAAAIAAAAGPPIDAAKVAAVRAAIAEGRYALDPQAIAAKMVDLDLPPQAVNSAAVDRLAAAQAALIDALDGGDLAVIEAASAAVTSAVVQLRSAGGWRPTPQLREALQSALRTGEGARVRTAYLADDGRRRLQALDTISGGARSAYRRTGR